MKQKYTSAGTSINRDRVPAIYKRVMIGVGDRILDYGCGKYTQHIIDQLPFGTAYHAFDPFNQPEEINASTRARLNQYPATVTILSNVLNVIDNDEDMVYAINDALSMTKPGRPVYATVYEGDRSGIGRATGKDQYQRNMRTRDFADHINRVSMGTLWADVLNGMIVIFPAC